MTPRRLTAQEVEGFASWPGVSRMAVENFLMTVFCSGETVGEALGNLANDAQAYKWNAETIKAIGSGILLAGK